MFDSSLRHQVRKEKPATQKVAGFLFARTCRQSVGNFSECRTHVAAIDLVDSPFSGHYVCPAQLFNSCTFQHSLYTAHRHRPRISRSRGGYGALRFFCKPWYWMTRPGWLSFSVDDGFISRNRVPKPVFQKKPAMSPCGAFRSAPRDFTRNHQGRFGPELG